LRCIGKNGGKTKRLSKPTNVVMQNGPETIVGRRTERTISRVAKTEPILRDAGEPIERHRQAPLRSPAWFQRRFLLSFVALFGVIFQPGGHLGSIRQSPRNVWVMLEPGRADDTSASETSTPTRADIAT